MAFTKINPQVEGNQTESPNLIDGHVCFFLPLQYLSRERATARNTQSDLSLEDTENENTADAQKGGDISEDDKMEIGMTYMKVFQTRDFLENLKTEIIKAKPPKAQDFKDPFVITKQRLIRDLQFCGINSFKDSDSSPSWSEGDDISDLNAKSVKVCYNNIGIFLDFMAEIFKRDSLDNRGCEVIASVNYEFNYPNAFYSSALGQVVFGTGFPMTGWMESDTKPVDDIIGIIGDFVTGIDIVAHELMHAVIQCTVSRTKPFTKPPKRSEGFLGKKLDKSGTVP
ncbi:Translation initiation factor 3 subunit b [Orbilia oligospora]|uniref:Translation initiation factor 3 subunit b n=1 Tax=Orbilia oligospora TaxID=2813651 RepID=A0A8H8VHL5_ORBOL|nr:Translation initiation factor 3 subunit b [Orbilia oligospora]